MKLVQDCHSFGAYIKITNAITKVHNARRTFVFHYLSQCWNSNFLLKRLVIFCNIILNKIYTCLLFEIIP